MKVLKMFLLIVTLFLSNIGVAQSPAIVKHASSKVEVLNKHITSINPSVPLSPYQVKIITDLHITNYTKIQAIKKAGDAEEELTIQHQKISAELIKNLLTKEQRKANKEWGYRYRAGKIVATPNKTQKTAAASSISDEKVATTSKITPTAKTHTNKPNLVKNGIKQADRINEILRLGDPNMILSIKQYEITKAKAMELTMQIGEIRKSGASDEQAQIKALRTAYNRDIKTTVLSKAQVTAFNKGWKRMQAAKK